MWSPFDSMRGRLAWSCAAGLIITWWVFVVLAAGSVQFFAQGQTLAKTMSDIAADFPSCVWPGEFGLASNRMVGIILQCGPLFAVAAWWLCLVQWRTRRARLLAAAGSMLIPCPLAVIAPHLVLLAPLAAIRQMDSTWDGEEYEETGLGAAVGLWWYLHLVLLAYTATKKVTTKGECPKCRYSTAGLTTPVCPECGTQIPREGKRGWFPLHSRA
jgi:hypothetical protein